MYEQPVSFRVLSSIEIRIGATALRIAAPRQRALLAQLLVNANQTVSAPKLIDGIWGNVPPQHPDSALHVVVCRLRRSLGPIASRLMRDSSGYRIELDLCELDLTRAQSHAVEARRTMRAGDPAAAAAMFDTALACWTGEPLADVAGFSFYDAAARDLRELRLAIVEARNAAYLRCGRHLDVLMDIDAWVKTEPWRERLRAHQMVALYRSDRQIEALAAYEDLRQLLVAEFGVDPHEDLQRLHGRILRRDPTLLANRGDVQLQPERADARGGGGDGAVGDLVERLRRIARHRADVFVVDGGPGVEKSWLVAELPNRVRTGERVEVLDIGDALRRMSLTDWLDATRSA